MPRLPDKPPLVVYYRMVPAEMWHAPGHSRIKRLEEARQYAVAHGYRGIRVIPAVKAPSVALAQSGG